MIANILQFNQMQTRKYLCTSKNNRKKLSKITAHILVQPIFICLLFVHGFASNRKSNHLIHIFLFYSILSNIYQIVNFFDVLPCAHYARVYFA